MKNKEERILITKCSSWCRALRISCDPFDDKDGMFCDKSGKWVRITEKDCAKCKSPVLAGITRSEAIERMAKAICRADNFLTSCEDCVYCRTENCQTSLENWFLDDAEAALDALLGKEAENGK